VLATIFLPRHLRRPSGALYSGCRLAALAVRPSDDHRWFAPLQIGRPPIVLNLRVHASASGALYQLLSPSLGRWSEKEKTNFVASKMPIPIGVDIEVRYGTRRRVPLRGASQSRFHVGRRGK
jgi:hypothetical protein